MRKECCYSWKPSNVLQKQKKAWMRDMQSLPRKTALQQLPTVSSQQRWECDAGVSFTSCWDLPWIRRKWIGTATKTYYIKEIFVTAELLIFHGNPIITISTNRKRSLPRISKGKVRWLRPLWSMVASSCSTPMGSNATVFGSCSAWGPCPISFSLGWGAGDKHNSKAQHRRVIHRRKFKNLWFIPWVPMMFCTNLGLLRLHFHFKWFTKHPHVHLGAVQPLWRQEPDCPMFAAWDP